MTPACALRTPGPSTPIALLDHPIHAPHPNPLPGFNQTAILDQSKISLAQCLAYPGNNRHRQ
ncbi:hypothetical protein EMCG_04825 [[Emmonsia] crescens]|uniref:Uncharacterized protein n=1 Tax=[Emmonsia] crescens TaxID=73230 RepID=A0A0G2HQX3_9EURO|nr:hypothetical protein EMCG_04825 [Emmonsia crescens UAMH 3008]